MAMDFDDITLSYFQNKTINVTIPLVSFLDPLLVTITKLKILKIQYVLSHLILKLSFLTLFRFL